VRYVAGRAPRERAFASALDDELGRLAASLGLSARRRVRARQREPIGNTMPA
jgi:hypothetical protein